MSAKPAWSNRPSSLTAEEFARIRELVESKLGVLVPDNKRAMVQSRLARRYRELGFDKAKDYFAYVFGQGDSGPEQAQLLEAITTNFTYFYREPQQLDYLASAILPELVVDAAERRRPLRVWSAACSTGEEPWTLAMLIDDVSAKVGRTIEYSVTATDVNTKVLETAERAVYSETALEKVPDTWVSRYFLMSNRQGSGRVRVVPGIRARVTFCPLNLMDAAYPLPHGYDVIFLRNVLIYFDFDTRQAVVSRLASHVRAHGFLLLGASETLNGMKLPLHYVQKAIYRKG